MKKQIWMAAVAVSSLALSGCADEFANLSAEELKLMWSDANSVCRGGPGDEATTQAYCDRRAELGQKLAALDWCYTSGEQASYLSTWRSCNEESDNANYHNTALTPDPVLPDDAFSVVKRREPNFSKLEITVAVDSLTINDIKVNKGNCLRSYVYGSGSRFPMDLKFGDKIYMGVFCDPIRLDFDTSSGGWWYKWG